MTTVHEIVRREWGLWVMRAEAQRVSDELSDEQRRQVAAALAMYSDAERALCQALGAELEFYD